MGCGSTKNVRVVRPIKKPLLLFDPLTTLKVIQFSSLQASISLASGQSEADQFPVISSRLYGTDKFLTIIINQLKNFPLTGGKIYPKIAYSLKDNTNPSQPISSSEDYHSFSTSGTDLSTHDIKIVLPLHDLKPKTPIFLHLSIKEAKLVPLEEIRSSFLFSIDPDIKRPPPETNILKVPTPGIEGSSINGLVFDSVTVKKDDEEIKEPYIIEYGKSLFLCLNGIKGLTKTNGELVLPGCTMMILDEEGEEVLPQTSMIPDDNPIHEDEFTEFTLQIKIGGEKFRPLKDYWWNVRLWDTKGNGEFGTKIRYQGSNKLKERATVYEVKQNGEEFEVKCKGETGLLRSNFVFIKTKKDIADMFSGNLEKSVELELQFEGDSTNKTNALELSSSNDGDGRKMIPWRLVSMMAR